MTEVGNCFKGCFGAFSGKITWNRDWNTVREEITEYLGRPPRRKRGQECLHVTGEGLGNTGERRGSRPQGN